MTVEEAFCDLYDTYGDDFNWNMIPLTQANGSFVQELKRELGKKHFLYNEQIWAVAKCESSDDVLYVTGDGTGKDMYYIFFIKTLIISKKPGNTGKSRDKDTEFTTHLLHSEGALTRCPFP